MGKRYGSGYKARGATRERLQAPILAFATEGKTEANYLTALNAATNSVRIRPKACKGKHLKALVDEALEYTNQLRAQVDTEEVEVLPAVVFDMERVSTQAIKEVKEAIRYAKFKGVKVWVSIPTIERWFHLHFKHIGQNRARRVIEDSLVEHLKIKKLSPYKKPGSRGFFSALIARVSVAKDLCAASHHSLVDEHKLPCICLLAEYIDSF